MVVVTDAGVDSREHLCPVRPGVLTCDLTYVEDLEGKPGQSLLLVVCLDHHYSRILCLDYFFFTLFFPLSLSLLSTIIVSSSHLIPPSLPSSCSYFPSSFSFSSSARNTPIAASSPLAFISQVAANALGGHVYRELPVLISRSNGLSYPPYGRERERERERE